MKRPELPLHWSSIETKQLMNLAQTIWHWRLASGIFQNDALNEEWSSYVS